MFDLKNILIESMFLGFGLFMVISSQLFWFRSNYKNYLLKGLTESAIFLVRVAGMLYLLYWVFQIFMGLNTEFSLLNRFDGVLAVPFWIYILTLPALSQLFWIKKIRERTLYRFLIGGIILIVSIVFSEHYNQAFRWIHSDYVELNEFFETFYIPVLKNILFFGIVLVITYLIQNKKKTKSLKQ